MLKSRYPATFRDPSDNMGCEIQTIFWDVKHNDAWDITTNLGSYQWIFERELDIFMGKVSKNCNYCKLMAKKAPFSLRCIILVHNLIFFSKCFTMCYIDI